MKLTNKLKNKWWLFTILSGIFAYLNPYFSFFSFFIIIILFFDVIYMFILKKHFKIFKEKLADGKYNHSLKKVFSKEIIFFKIGKIFTSFFIFLIYIIIFVENLEDRQLLTSFYIPLIKNNFILQVLCMTLAIASIVYSSVLFWLYTNSCKQKLNEVEPKQ
jgi:hypothetical protein